jgi:tRNA (cytidine/uridine-2'-O-)-methyltransferase
LPSFPFFATKPYEIICEFDSTCPIPPPSVEFVVLDPLQKSLNIVLVEPEIPNNTGSVGRTCVGTNSKLHLVGKLGFEISDKQLKRAGLDYWQHLDWIHHADWESWWSQIPDLDRVFFFSKKTTQCFFDIEYRQGDWLVFGKETKGLEDAVLERHKSNCVQIPILGPIRSYNLSNAVMAAACEALRQIGWSTTEK